MSAKLEVGLACGRNYLSVNGFVVAMEGDLCRDAELPGTHWNRELLEAVKSGRLPKPKKSATTADRYSSLPSLDAEAEYIATRKQDREKFDVWAAKMLRETEAAVETDGYGKLKLWSEWAVENPWADDKEPRPRVYWEQIGQGLIETVGVIRIGKEEMPVCVSMFWNRLRAKPGDAGHLVMFWETTSQVVDHRMVDRWFKENLRKNVQTSDAMNFANVIHAVVRP